MLLEVVKSAASNGVRIPLSMALWMTVFGAGGVNTFNEGEGKVYIGEQS